jgi:tetratricopeptide (TPR) repeat protein
LFINENPNQYLEKRSLKSKTLQIIENDTTTSPYKLYAIAEINFHWALVRLKHKDFLKAALEIAQGYKALKENRALFPGFIPNLKFLGAIHILIGTMPQEYKWIFNLAGFQGSMEQGIEDINRFYEASNHQKWAHLKNEAIFFKYITRSHVLAENPKEKPFPSYLSFKTNSPIIKYLQADAYMKTGKINKAKNILDQAVTVKLPYLLYMRGLLKLSNLEGRDTADFKKYIQTQPRHFVKSSYQKLAWNALVRGDTNHYFFYLKKVKANGDLLFDADRQAQKEAERMQVPCISLLMSRLAFDGGDYKKALEVLITAKHEEEFKTQEHHLEYIYRLARIYHKLKNLDKAKGYYKLTIELGKDSPFYFAANSALQLGLINETKGNKNKAAQYYHSCVEMKNHTYENSLEQKAKAGLQRLGFYK